ncbi:hypothetical protein KP003_02915 [Geomonas nitrogeniifigens]|uniref:hypothetical protein n=1 Tax=Geomonas diazotrophica TaxID=2843197 RepID=UPI001C2C6EB4|nr:hypothetical protein [Geomonas nitrogeniifigens]QXE87376.1 hypothetical protein KP003_02915 [Geomonas nitrogeniifigens]
MNLTTFFESAVVELNRQKGSALGDRTQYIGSSDVAGCARKACLQRLSPSQPDLRTLLKFARGHAAEWLINNIFQAGSAKHLYDEQVEVCHPQLPLKAHIDFLFFADMDGKPQLHAVEVKSVSGIPDVPYQQWEDQLMFQLGLLRLQYPIGDLGGSILAVDLNAGEIHQFNGYKFDEETFSYLLYRGQHLLDALNGMVAADPSPSHLCGYCQFRSDCPSMVLPRVNLPDEIEMLAGKYLELNTEKVRAEKEMKAIRQELVDFTGSSFKGRSANYDLTVTAVDGGMAVDASLLKSLHPDIYPTVLKPRAGYSRLEVRSVKKKEAIPKAA